MVRIEAITKPITITINRSPRVHEQADVVDAVDAAWQGLCAQNPRYFNGQMIAFDSYDPTTSVIRASVEQYKHHAVRDTVDVGISLLAVTAIIAAPNEQGAGHYLLGKRSPKTHRYGNLWELGPSGGVDVPANQISTLDFYAIVAELKREIAEEVGLMIDRCACSPVALVHDDAVGSVDIAIQIELEQMPDLARSWEYVDTRWVSQPQLIEWVKKHPEDLIPTTVALALRLSHEH